MTGWLGDGDGPMGDHGAFMDSELQVPRADLAAHIRQLEGPRNLIALVGAPGSGKSHLARQLAQALGDEAAIVPMDGFHQDNAWLDARGLRAVKGAPQTFDVAALHACLERLRDAREPCTVPIFDRDIDAVVPDGDTVPARARYILIEGNYLLLTQPAWRELYPLFDLSVRIEVPEAELRARLIRRWQQQGFAPDIISKKVEQNDLPNGRVMLREGRAADLVVRD